MDRFGRKLTLLGIGILYIVSAVRSGPPTDVYSFMLAWAFSPNLVTRSKAGLLFGLLLGPRRRIV